MRFSLVLLAAAVAAASGAPAAHAAFVASATGTSVSGDYTLRYAVFQRDGGETEISGAGNSGVAASDFNPLPFVSGLPPVFDDGAFSAFFYQVIGPAVNSDLVLSLSNMLGADFTSAGFVDNGSVAGLNAQSGGGFVNGGYEADGTGEGANLTFDLDDPITGGAAPSNVLFATTNARNIIFDTGSLSFVSASGNDTAIFANVAVAAVPEPGSMILFGLFGVVGAGMGFRKRSAAAVAV